jgi:hypothetical protein
MCSVYGCVCLAHGHACVAVNPCIVVVFANNVDPVCI